MVKRLSHSTATIFLYLFIFLFFFNKGNAQSGTQFWFAPPDITDLHHEPGGEPINLVVSSNGLPATITIDIPANPSFTPIVVNLAANKSQKINLTAYKALLETRPTNTVCNTGLRVVSSASITCYYECANSNNTDIWALKGPNSLGTEFYIPLHKHAPFYNHTFASPHLAFASFDICATQNNTQVTIYTPTPVDGHPALSQFTITLNQGQTYSCGWTGANYEQPSTHPSGAVVLADKPVTVSLKDDSNHNPSGGCYDILGDQIVPVEILGTDYIAVKGSLNNNGDESVVLLATQNNTQVFVNGSATPVATLFAGEYYRVDMDYLSTGTDNSVYVRCSKPTYAMHITGFGCEAGMAQLPPLNCAGSQQLNFTRGSSETFYITLLCRSAAVNGFTVQGSGTATIPATAFVDVPGTSGVWKSARITYNTTQAPVDTTFRVTNTIDVFALGIVNGGASSGCRYGYFSEFVAPITVNAGENQTICANTTATLLGHVAGGTTTGIWTTSGSGTFNPNATALNAVYNPSAGDAAVGFVTLTLTSTGACNPVSDQMVLTILPAPISNAGADVSRCRNNANVQLAGSVTHASGGVWTGGNGIYVPGNNVLNAIYTPTQAEILSGSLVLTLTTTGNGLCNPVADNVMITFTPAPTINAGANQTKCANNAATVLTGSVTVATGGAWSGGGGTFSPSATSLSPIYTPTTAEIANGSVTLTLTSTGNGTCNAVTDDMTIFFTATPQVGAGPDQTKCANNAVIQLAGTVSVATGIQWSGGLGLFLPNSTALNATYTPTTTEINNGSVTLTITSTGNGNCNNVNDQITIFFTPAPTVNAGNDITICANNAMASLNGTYTVATGIIWSGGAGVFSPNNLAANATYTPTPTERTNGSVALTLSTTGSGNCTSVSDIVIITISPAPIVNAGNDITVCSNNASATLNGQISSAAGGIWSGGSGNFSPSTNALNPIYTPSATEISNGSVTLTLTSTGNGNCNAVSDQVTIFFTTSPTVDAGINQTKCANNAIIQLAGTVSIATGIQWSGGLGIFQPSSTSLNASYTPTTAEINSGSITLTITTTGNGNCNSVSDVVTIFFTPAPTINADSDITICANNAVAALNGSYTIAGGAAWSGGAGTFLPNNTTLNATYTPTPAEITNGSVMLTLSSTGNGNCTVVSDQVVIHIAPAPTVNAGNNITMCSNNAAAALAGQVSGATGGVWSGGSGGFSPSTTSLNPVYTPTATEIANGSVTLTLTSTGNGNCLAVSDQITIFFSASPTIDAGANQTKCANNAIIQLAGTVSVATGIQWSGGLGLFSPNNTTLNASYTPTAAEINNGSITLTITSTGNGNCTPVTDQVTIFFTAAPTITAGNDITICANNASAPLNGQFTVATGAIWSGGSGTFSPNYQTINATYTPTQAEIASGSITLTLTTTGNNNCIAVSDVVVITITPSPVVNAGANISACQNNATVTLNGQVFGASGGTWSGGNGTFFPNNNVLNATYTPSTSEIESGLTTLTLTSTGNGTCNATTSVVNISFAPSPVVNAGADQTLCSNNAIIQLNGAVNHSAGGQWTGGLGVFAPSSAALNATYTPTATEIAQGFVTLTLTTTGNGSCIAASDQMTATFTASPTANAGSDLTSCANNAQVTLNSSYAVSTGAVWSGGTGSYSPSGNNMQAVYTPSNAEINAGTATLILTTIGNGNCLPVSDEVTINITPSPVVNAGENQIVCVNNLNVALSGSIVGITNTGIWTTNGTGTFLPNNTALNATYILSAADSLAGGATLTLTSTNNATCIAVSDQMQISVLPAGTASAGNDVTVCGNNALVTLNGSVGGGATSGTWTTTGTGAFAPNNTTLNATYVPSAFDIASGSVNLTFTANSCNTATDQLTITITAAPEVHAGNDQIVCSTIQTIELDGVITGATTSGTWTTNGTGMFSPSSASLEANYTPSSADVNTQNLIFILTSTNNGICVAVSDTINVNIYPNGTVNAGADQILCANNPNAVIQGILGGGATQGVWSTSGSGSFIPNTQSLDATYIPSDNDILTGNVSLVLTATNSCNTAIDFMNIIFSAAPIVDAGADQFMCGNNPNISLNGSAQNATGAIWSGGAGSFIPNTTSLNAIYVPTASEQAAGSVILTLTSTGNGNCNEEIDQIVIHFSNGVIVNAGVDQSVCNTSTQTSLQGNVSNGSTTGAWTTLGSGTFSPDANALNAIYSFSVADLASESVTLVLTSTNNGICPASTDTLVITFGDAAFAFAGNDQNICASFEEINLNGLIGGGATQGTWTTNGFGSIINANAIQTTYNISPTDIANGSVTFTLTTTDHGVCLPGTDEVTFTISQSSIVNAGADLSVCGNNNAQLQGLVSGASSTGAWTSNGSGQFIPNNTDLNAQYIPSANDSLNGQVIITLTSTNTGLCPIANDALTVNIEKPATVFAGNDFALCAEVNTVSLYGTITGGTQTGVWSSSGSGTFSPDNTSLTNTYTASSSDISSGSVSLYLTSTGLSICNNTSDTLHISFTSLSDANAGADVATCGISPVQLSGNVSGPSVTGVWSTLGSGSFSPDNQTLNAIYHPSLNDSIAGTVQLILTSANTGICSPDSDSLTITINSSSQVNAGNDQSICATQNAVSLNGIITGGIQTGVWTTTGSGTFAPNNQTLNATYSPSAADVLNGNIQLMLSSASNGTCPSVQDQLTITFIPQETVNAGNDRILCEDAVFMDLAGLISGENATGIWITTGTGSFTPSATNLNATYNFSQSDITIGELIFILTPTSTSLCPALPDTFTVNLVPAPIAAFSTQTGEDLDVLFTDESIGAGTWFWNFGIGGTSTLQNPTYVYPEPGTYDVSLVVTAAGGCSDTATAQVRVLGDIGTPIAIPTGFSPNNDGTNDELRVLGGPFVEVDFRVYNGWGNLVFSTTDPGGSWDGTYKGEPQPGGVYVFTATGVTIKGRHVKTSGSVTLIR